MILRSEKGIAALEVALILPMLAMLLYCLVEGGNMLSVYTSMSEASRGAARQIVLSGETAGTSDLVQNLAPDLSPGDLTTTVSTDTAKNLVTVEVQYDYQSIFNLDSGLGEGYPELFTLSAQTSMPLP